MSELSASEKALKTWVIARLKEEREKVKETDDHAQSYHEGARDAFEEILEWWFR